MILGNDGAGRLYDGTPGVPDLPCFGPGTTGARLNAFDPNLAYFSASSAGDFCRTTLPVPKRKCHSLCQRPIGTPPPPVARHGLWLTAYRRVCSQKSPCSRTNATSVQGGGASSGGFQAPPSNSACAGGFEIWCAPSHEPGPARLAEEARWRTVLFESNEKLTRKSNAPSLTTSGPDAWATAPMASIAPRWTNRSLRGLPRGFWRCPLPLPANLIRARSPWVAIESCTLQDIQDMMTSSSPRASPLNRSGCSRMEQGQRRRSAQCGKGHTFLQTVSFTR